MQQIKQLSFKDFRKLAGASELIEEYGNDQGDREVGKPDANLDAYEYLDDQGVLRTIVAIVDDKVVGLVIALVSLSRHYKEPAVTVDAIYLRNAYRKSGLGLGLLAKLAEVTRAEGARGYALVAHPDSKLDRLCRAKGDKPIRHLYWRAVDVRTGPAES